MTLPYFRPMRQRTVIWPLQSRKKRFHGEKRGSIALGRANNINDLAGFLHSASASCKISILRGSSEYERYSLRISHASDQCDSVNNYPRHGARTVRGRDPTSAVYERNRVSAPLNSSERISKIGHCGRKASGINRMRLQRVPRHRVNDPGTDLQPVKPQSAIFLTSHQVLCCRI